MNSSTYRFKSKLSNLFNRKSLLLKERLIYEAKKIRIIFKWGIQIIIYPLYFLIHTQKIDQKRFKEANYSLNVFYSNTDFYLEKIKSLIMILKHQILKILNIKIVFNVGCKIKVEQ